MSKIATKACGNIYYDARYNAAKCQKKNKSR